MGILGRDRAVDDIDVESCLANLHRLEGLDPFHILDLTDRERSELHLEVPELLADSAKR